MADRGRGEGTAASDDRTPATPVVLGRPGRPRREPPERPVVERTADWAELHQPFDPALASEQAGRCLDCGVPFCHGGCPLGNVIPEWNGLASAGRIDAAYERLAATNNFPEITGRLCPAPCEAACVVGLSDEPVAIRAVEEALAEEARRRGLRPVLAGRRTGRRVAVVGSGPAGLAAAQQLARAGHEVTVYEASERPGGLLREGIPSFKLDKAVLDDRLRQLEAEGVRFVTCCEVGRDLPVAEIDADAWIVAIGAGEPRELPIPGRELDRIYQAMQFLPLANRWAAGGELAPELAACADARVVILGGGDTGADCLGTVHRLRARSVVQVEILPEPPRVRDPETPWPTWPRQLRTSPAHHEGGERRFSLATERFLGGPEGRVAGLVVHEVRPRPGDPRSLESIPGREEVVPADVVLLALGFVGVRRGPLLEALGLPVDPGGRLVRDDRFAAPRPGVFVAGDAGRGQSLIVWAIAEGRAAAAAADAYLGGGSLPAPIRPTSRPLAVTP